MMQETTILAFTPVKFDAETQRVVLCDKTGNVHTFDLALKRFVHPIEGHPLKYQPTIWSVKIADKVVYVAFNASFDGAEVFYKILTLRDIYLGPVPWLWQPEVVLFSKGHWFFHGFEKKHTITDIDFDVGGKTLSFTVGGDKKSCSLDAGEVCLPHLWKDDDGLYYGYSSGLFDVGVFRQLGTVASHGLATDEESKAFSLFAEPSKFEGCQEEDGSFSLLRRDLKLGGNNKCPQTTNAKLIKSLLDTAPLTDSPSTAGVQGAEAKVEETLGLICELDADNSLVVVNATRAKLQLFVGGCGNVVLHLAWYLVVVPIFHVLLAVVVVTIYIVMLFCMSICDS